MTSDGEFVERLRAEAKTLSTLYAAGLLRREIDQQRLRRGAHAIYEAAERIERMAADIERLSTEVDFWDHLHDEGFPDDPWTLGALRAEVERLREGGGCPDVCARQAAAQLRPDVCVCAHGVKRRIDRLMKEARRG